MSSSYERYLESKDLSKSTVKHYHKHTLDFLAWLDADNTEAENATAKEVTAYLNHLKKKGLANVTRSIQLNVLKHFFDYQIQQGQRESNPAAHIKIRGAEQKKLYPLLSKLELESIYQNYEIPTTEHRKAKCNWFNNYKLSRQRNKTILGLMVWQGLTTPEINRLTPQDLKLREGTIYIGGSRKSKERTLELKPQQIIELMEYQFTTRTELLKLCAEQPPYLYIGTPAAGKKTATGQEAVNIWKRLSEEVAAINPRFINFKQIRASVITHWLNQYNLRQVQYLAGHKFVSSTENYLVNQVEDLLADIDQYHPLG